MILDEIEIDLLVWGQKPQKEYVWFWSIGRMDRIPFIGRRARIAWWFFTIVLSAILVYVIISYLGAFVLGVFIYYATRPIYERFAHRIQFPSVGVAIALLTISLPVLILVGYTVSIAIGQLNGVAIPGFDTFRSVLGPYFDFSGIDTPHEFISSIANNPQQIQQLISPETIQQLLESAGMYLGVLASGLLQVFIAFAVAFYLLRDDHKLAGWAKEAIGRNNETLIAYGEAVDQDLKTVFFGNILNAFVVAITSAFTYNVLNFFAPSGIAVPVPTLLGLLTGAASLIPVVGMKAIYVPIGVYLGVVAGLSNPSVLWFPVVFLLVTAALIDGLTELILRPYISGRNLHVGLVLFAYVLGPLIFGWYGLFLGPLLLVLIIHLARIVLPELVHGEPLTPDALGADLIPDMDEPHDDTSDTNSADTEKDADADTEDAVEDTDRDRNRDRDSTDDATDGRSSSRSVDEDPTPTDPSSESV